jgi:hypothetical protein
MKTSNSIEQQEERKAPSDGSIIRITLYDVVVRFHELPKDRRRAAS